jgi:hypothetical protein
MHAQAKQAELEKQQAKTVSSQGRNDVIAATEAKLAAQTSYDR